MTPEQIPPGWKRYVCTGCGTAEASPLHEPGGWGWGKDGGLLCPPHLNASRAALYDQVRNAVYVPAQGPIPVKAYAQSARPLRGRAG